MIFKKILQFIEWKHYCFLVDHFPHKAINQKWQRDYGYNIDWDSPKNLNEKIQWLMCFGDTSRWADLADKYKVRKFVEEKGYGHLLPQLLGVWDDARKIDFSLLPNKFILKCNHDSGSYCKVNKSEEFDKDSICRRLNAHLKQKFGYKNCEPHYNKISPRLIIAEEFLESETDGFSDSLVDYKVWCFNGEPAYIWVYYNRNHEGTDFKLYDLNWEEHKEKTMPNKFYRDGNAEIKRPRCFKEMLLAAKSFSTGFPEVRVDFYIVNGRLYFGEMTFTSNCGRMNHFTEEYMQELGNRILV